MSSREPAGSGVVSGRPTESLTLAVVVVEEEEAQATLVPRWAAVEA